MNPIFFQSALEFREWLELNHDSKKELYVGYYKVKTNKPTMTWSESVDQALCFGWIDGVRKSIDDESYCIRFTPRKIKSTWSKVNLNKMKNLINNNLVTESGLRVFECRVKESVDSYSYEKQNITLKEEYYDQFKSDEKAWNYFNDQTSYYKKKIIHWIMSAKKEETRASRLNKAIVSCRNSNRLF